MRIRSVHLNRRLSKRVLLHGVSHKDLMVQLTDGYMRVTHEVELTLLPAEAKFTQSDRERVVAMVAIGMIEITNPR